MASGLTLKLRWADLPLFESTCASYAEAIERGEMDVTEAQNNLEALALGMLELDVESYDK